MNERISPESEDTQPCVSCGHEVPCSQTHPFHGHAPDCKLREEWIKDFVAVEKFQKLIRDLPHGNRG